MTHKEKKLLVDFITRLTDAEIKELSKEIDRRYKNEGKVWNVREN